MPPVRRPSVIGSALLTFLGGVAAVSAPAIQESGAAIALMHGTESGCGPQIPRVAHPNSRFIGVVALAKKSVSYRTVFYSFPHDTFERWCIVGVPGGRVRTGRLRGRVMISAEFWSTAFQRQDIQRFVAFLRQSGDYSQITVVTHPKYH